MRILVVDDNDSLARGLVAFLNEEKHQAISCGTVKNAVDLLSRSHFDLVITDLKLPDGSGIEVSKHARAAVPPAEVILMTAFGTVETAVEAMKLGALDYLVKPVPLEELAFRLDRVEKLRKLQNRAETLQRVNLSLLEVAGLANPLDRIVGESNAIKKVKELIKKIAPYPSTVLLTGETGTGKEMAARAIHALSANANGPFVRVNCAAIPATLFESELFGHERGAFTDAKERKIGSFEAAKDGTLFLDEVGEVPLELQAKLLRALQEKEIVRVGGTQPIIVETRIIAATNRDLDKMSREGKFREDLLFRLSVIRINMPSLKERKEDIKVIAIQLLQDFKKDFGKPNLQFSDEVFEFLANQEWRGNIRELKNAIERAVVLAEGDLITCDDFLLPTPTFWHSQEVNDSNKTSKLLEILAETEKRLIIEALERNNWKKIHAANELGIPRTNLLYRMKKLGIREPNEKV